MAFNMNRNPDQDVDMMDIDIDDDFDDDELNAFLEAHGLDGDGPQGPRGPPPPSGQRPPERAAVDWKGKGKAVDPDEDLEEYDDRPPPSAQRQPGFNHGAGRDYGWKGKGKGKEKAYGQGDVLGLDHSAAFGNRSRPGGSAGPGRDLGPGREAGLVRNPGFGKDNVPSRDSGYGKGDILGLDAPTLPVPIPGGRVDKVRDWLQTMDLDSDLDLDDEADDEAEQKPEAAILGTPPRPKRVISPSPDPTLGSSPPVMSGLSIRSKQNNKEEETIRQAAPAPAQKTASKVVHPPKAAVSEREREHPPNNPPNAGIRIGIGNQNKPATIPWKTFREARLADEAEAEAERQAAQAKANPQQAAAQGAAQAQTESAAAAAAAAAEGGGGGPPKPEGQGEEGAGGDILDPYDSEVSIAACPIVSHDPDYGNRAIDLDVKAARGVVRYMIMNGKFPEVWPLNPLPANVPGPNEKGIEREAAADPGKGRAGKIGERLKDVGIEGTGEDVVREDEGQTAGKDVVTPKGVVMLVTGIQYLKMPDDTPSPSELGSEEEYEYEYYDDDDSQQGSSPPPSPGAGSSFRGLASEGGTAKGDDDDNDDEDYDYDVGLRGGNGGDEDYDMDSYQEATAGPREEVQETDFEDSDISMSNVDADYQLPPSSQAPPPPPSQLSRTSQKRTWSQRRGYNSSASSSSRSVLSVDNHRGDPFYGLPPPHPPSESSSSQPPMGPPNLLIRLQLYDGEFWVQALLRPEFHYLVLGKDFDEWASEPDVEDGKEVVVGEAAKSGAGTEGNAGKGKDGKEKTAEELAKEEEKKEVEMQTKWHKKWVKKARGDVREGSYVRLVGDVIVEFEEVEVEVVPRVRPEVVAAVAKMGQTKRNPLLKDISCGPLVPRKIGVQDTYMIGITDDGIGDPERLEKLRKEAMERKQMGNGMQGGPQTKQKDVDNNKADDKPKTTKMICLIVGNMVPVGYDRKFIRELKKEELRAMEEELGPAPPVPASPTASEKEKAKKKEEAEKKEPEPPQPWWVETGYRAELERKEQERLAELRKQEAEKYLAEYTRPDFNKILPPGWENMTIWEVDAFMKEWEKKNKPKEPKPPKPPKPVSKPIITARQEPKFFRSSITAQEIFQLQNPDRPLAKPRLEYEAKPLQRPEPRPAAIEVNQVYQRRILELPRRREPRVQKEPEPRPQQQPEPQTRPHLQPNPLLRPPQPRPQAQVQSRPQPYSVVQPAAQPHPQLQPQLRPQPQLQPQAHRPQLQPQLLPHPTGPQFQPRKQPVQQFQPQPQAQLQAQQHRPPQPPQPQPPISLPPPKPNPHLATDPTIPLKLCPLRQIPHLPFAQNWMCNVLAIVVSNSDVEPCPFPPSFTQRIVRLADQSTTKHILLNVFLDAEDFNPKPGEVVLLMGVKNHKYEGGSLKKYWSDRPPEDVTRWKWWVGEEALLEIGWCKGLVEGLRGWWREKRERERERLMVMVKGREEGG